MANANLDGIRCGIADDLCQLLDTHLARRCLPFLSSARAHVSPSAAAQHMGRARREERHARSPLACLARRGTVDAAPAVSGCSSLSPPSLTSRPRLSPLFWRFSDCS
jgi:hypothetical protein